jgi:hypothetical protein
MSNYSLCAVASLISLILGMVIMLLGIFASDLAMSDAIPCILLSMTFHFWREYED